MNQISDKLAGNEYYHGTMGYKALQILYEGFRFKKDYSDYGSYGTLRHGLYLTKSLSVAGRFGSGYVFKCCLKKGISILWLNEKYDPKVIQYLKREFSKNILTGPISKAIPMNKNLTKNELIHLLNYRYGKTNWSKRKDSDRWRLNLFSFRQQLLLHKYDGVGEPETEVGLVIFNPSFVEPIELYEVFVSGKIPWEYNPEFFFPAYTLRQMNKKKFIVEIDRDYEDCMALSSEPLSQEDIKEREYIRSLQKKYCQDHGLL